MSERETAKPESISLEDCNRPEDLERLNPVELVELMRPATVLDLHRLRLATQDQLAQLAEVFRERVGEATEAVGAQAQINRSVSDQLDEVASQIEFLRDRLGIA